MQVNVFKPLLHMLVYTLALLSIVPSSHAQANIYRANIAIAQSAPQTQTQSLQQGLLQILRKITTTREFEHNPAIKEAMENPEQYVKSYRTIKQNDSSVLIIDYQRRDILALLKSANLQRWRETSPNLLTWVTIQKSDSLQVIDDETPLLSAPLLDTAAQLGLSIQLPSLDLEQLAKISVDTLTQASSLQRMSAHYKKDAILSIHITRTSPTDFHSNWLYIDDRRSEQWTSDAKTLITLYEEGFEHLKQNLATSSLEGSMLLNISNINSQQDNDKLLNFLKAVKGITHVELDSLTPDSVLYQIKVNKLPTIVQKELTTGKTLIFDDFRDDTYYFHLKT